MLRDRFCCDCVGVNRSDDSQNGSPKRWISRQLSGAPFPFHLYLDYSTPSPYIKRGGSASPNEPGIKSVAALQREVAINFPTCSKASPGASQLQARPPFATRERDKQNPGVQLIIRPDGVNTRGEADIRKEYFVTAQGHLCCGIVSVVIVSGLIAATIRRTAKALNFWTVIEFLFPRVGRGEGTRFMGCHLCINSCAGSCDIGAPFPFHLYLDYSTPSPYIKRGGSASPNEPGIKSVAALQREVAINFPTCSKASPGASQLQARPPFATRERDKQNPGVQLIIRPDGVNTRGEADIRKEYFVTAQGHLCCGIVSVVIVSGLIAATIRRTSKALNFWTVIEFLFPRVGRGEGTRFMGCHLCINSCAGSCDIGLVFSGEIANR
ncbi:hypothetical protein CDAR_456901 [Caerostris darwini]|uniref:4Fe-4S ferredoxin-type domain-containing protein n=1 Tax=Caerostris darwini TaxID=1538125 RepID=A0AAV4T2Z4_9ARAC|nr:hypothetical protein CDAR_456901 [Caerostris darwini]